MKTTLVEVTSSALRRGALLAAQSTTAPSWRSNIGAALILIVVVALVMLGLNEVALAKIKRRPAQLLIDRPRELRNPLRWGLGFFLAELIPFRILNDLRPRIRRFLIWIIVFGLTVLVVDLSF